MTNDEEDLVEDVDTGILHPTKVAKIMHVGIPTESIYKKCDKNIGADESMTNHMRTHKQAEKIKIKCDHCVFETHDGDILLNHTSETHIKFEKCLTCSQMFVNMADLVTHAFKEHAKNNSNKCAVCSEEFNSVEILIHHILRIHHLVNEQTLQTTEAGIQLEKVWPNENAANFKCY